MASTAPCPWTPCQLNRAGDDRGCRVGGAGRAPFSWDPGPFAVWGCWHPTGGVVFAPTPLPTFTVRPEDRRHPLSPVPCLSLPTGTDYRVGAKFVGGVSLWAGPQHPHLCQSSDPTQQGEPGEWGFGGGSRGGPGGGQGRRSLVAGWYRCVGEGTWERLRGVGMRALPCAPAPG